MALLFCKESVSYITITSMPRFQNSIVRVGLVQMKSGPSAEKNLQRAVASIKKLAKRGADIVCLPELFLTPYFCQTFDRKNFKLAETVPGPTTRALGAATKAAGVTVIASVFEQTTQGRYFNAAVVLNEHGKLIGKYRKMHIPDDLKNYYGEAHYFEPGNLGFRSFKTRRCSIGTLICWDQWFPEGARATAAKGAQILFYPTAIGWQPKERLGIKEAEHEAWQVMQRAHAIANNIFVVAVNRVGLDNKLTFWGTSFVSDPYGRVIAKAPSNREADLLVVCDLSLIPSMRHDWPFLEARRIKVEK